MHQQHVRLGWLLVFLVVSQPALATVGNLTVGSSTVLAPAISDDGHGAIAKVHVEALHPGTGRVFVDSHGAVADDLMFTIQVATRVAARELGQQSSQYDFIVTLLADGKQAQGTSAGLPVTIAAMDAIAQLTVSESPSETLPFTALTGSVLLDGSIGPVGSLREKGEALVGTNATVFLHPISAIPGCDESALRCQEFVSVQETWAMERGAATSLQADRPSDPSVPPSLQVFGLEARHLAAKHISEARRNQSGLSGPDAARLQESLVVARDLLNDSHQVQAEGDSMAGVLTARGAYHAAAEASALAAVLTATDSSTLDELAQACEQAMTGAERPATQPELSLSQGMASHVHWIALTQQARGRALTEGVATPGGDGRAAAHFAQCTVEAAWSQAWRNLTGSPGGQIDWGRAAQVAMADAELAVAYGDAAGSEEADEARLELSAARSKAEQGQLAEALVMAAFAAGRAQAPLLGQYDPSQADRVLGHSMARTHEKMIDLGVKDPQIMSYGTFQAFGSISGPERGEAVLALATIAAAIDATGASDAPEAEKRVRSSPAPTAVGTEIPAPILPIIVALAVLARRTR